MRHVPFSMLASRLLAIPASIFVIATLAFWMIRLTGSNAAATLAGEYADAEAIAAVERELGLDRGLWTQYVDYIGQLLRGDLGTSYFTKQPVTDEILGRLPLDLVLGGGSLLVAVLVGVGLGAVAAYGRGRWPDTGVRVAVSALQSLPDYVLSLLLIYVLFFLLGWFPAPVGQLVLGAQAPPHVTGVVLLDALIAGQWTTALYAANQLYLPVIGFGLVLAAVFAKVTRSTFSTVLSSPMIQYAKACGLPPRRVFWSAFTASRSAVLTTVAIVTGAIIGGGAIMQKIFTLDGAAAFGVDSIFKMDLPVIQGVVVVFGGLTVVVFLVIDIVILLTDPRVRRRA